MPERLSAHPADGLAVPMEAALARIVRGVGASGLGQIVAFLQTVCLVPFFIGAWGVEGYGRWVTLTSFVAYLGLIEFGGQPYIANLVAEAHAKRDGGKIGSMLSEATSFFVFLGAAALLPIAVLAAFLAPADMWVLGAMSAVTLFFGIPVGVYLTVYRGTGLFVRGMMLGNALRLGGVAISAAALSVGISLKGYAISMLAVAAFQTAAIVWDTRNMIPACRDVRIGFRSALAGRSYLKGSVYCWLIAVAQSLMQQGLIFILAVHASSSDVAIYATHRTLANISGYAGLLLLGPMIPEIAFFWANDRFFEVQNVTILSIKYVVIATGALAAVLWLTAPLIYPLWTGKQLTIDSVLLFVLLLQGVLAAGWATSAWGLLATNQFRPLAGWYLANAVVTIGLALCWVKVHGLLGIAFASLIGDVMCGLLVFPALASSCLKIPVAKIYGALLKSAAALVPLLVFAALAAHSSRGWASLGLFLISAPFWAYPMLCLALGREEAGGALRRLRAILAARLGLEA